MTRFARAFGSKASNQRTAEDSTPWSQLKLQVTQDKQDLDDNNEKGETKWKSVLEVEKKIEENKKSVWCEFEVEKHPESGNCDKVLEKTKGKKRKSGVDDSLLDKLSNEKGQPSPVNSEPTSKKLKQSNLKHLQSKLKLTRSEISFQLEENSEHTKEQGLENNTNVTNSFISKRNKRKSPKIENLDDSSSEIDVKNGNLDENPDPRHDEEIENVSELNQEVENEIEKRQDKSSVMKHRINNQNKMKRNNTITWKNKNLKEQNSQGYKRRKCDEGDVKFEINGEEIWVTRLDGFYIKKEDAERIKQLEKDLLQRGISKQEVRAAIKKERRNAEKSLARQKKKVCYHCRKGGHTLSSCPKLEANGAPVTGSGMCYKCGSTEHTHFQCKVVSGNSFKFATCFVCKQEGHISKQCPDNPRGMYPTGGGCRLCGDVTHFRRECPTLQKKSNKVTAGLMDQDVEKLGDDADVPASKNFSKRKNKIVKFN